MKDGTRREFGRSPREPAGTRSQAGPSTNPDVDTRFDVLDAFDAADHARWLDAWRALPARDTAAHPAYARLFHQPAHAIRCALFETPHGRVLLPFVVRPVHREPWASLEAPCFDLSSPYGPGGPFVCGEVDLEEFWKRFDRWAEGAKTVAAFIRFAVLPHAPVGFCGSQAVSATCIVRDLRPGLERIWTGYEHKVRKNVNKARRSGVVVALDPTGARLKEFLEIYYATLDRRHADRHYYFPEAFFRSMIDELGGGFQFFHAIVESRVVSTELVLVSETELYSFLGGTLADSFAVRPNDLLKHRIIEWGVEQGKQAFVLGGGYSPDDGVFQYKKSFAPDGEVTFTIGKRVYDPALYEDLVRQRLAFERRSGCEWVPRPGFFPAYRG